MVVPVERTQLIRTLLEPPQEMFVGTGRFIVSRPFTHMLRSMRWRFRTLQRGRPIGPFQAHLLGCDDASAHALESIDHKLNLLAQGQLWRHLGQLGRPPVIDAMFVGTRYVPVEDSTLGTRIRSGWPAWWSRSERRIYINLRALPAVGALLPWVLVHEQSHALLTYACPRARVPLVIQEMFADGTLEILLEDFGNIPVVSPLRCEHARVTGPYSDLEWLFGYTKSGFGDPEFARATTTLLMFLATANHLAGGRLNGFMAQLLVRRPLIMNVVSWIAATLGISRNDLERGFREFRI